MDTAILEDIGLSAAETKIYLTLLELGPSTSGPIIDKSQLQSSVVHRVIKTLIEKGLVTFVKVGKDKQYQATGPENILHYVDLKRKKLAEVLPELQLKQSLAKEKNEVEMFLGKKAIFSLLDNLIKDAQQREEFYSFSLIEPHDDKEIILFYKHYNALRWEKKLSVRVLVNRTVKPIYEKNYSQDLLRKANVRYTDFHFPQGIIIFRNQVIFLNWQEKPSAIKITNNTMSEQFKEFFLEFYDKEKPAY